MKDIEYFTPWAVNAENVSDAIENLHQLCHFSEELAYSTYKGAETELRQVNDQIDELGAYVARFLGIEVSWGETETGRKIISDETLNAVLMAEGN